MASDEITKEQNKILAELAAFRSFVEAKFSSLDSRLSSLESSFDSRMSSLESRLDSLEERVAKKLLETKPIWVAELNNRIDELSNKIDVLSSDIIGVRGSQRAVNERLSTLEREHHERV